MRRHRSPFGISAVEKKTTLPLALIDPPRRAPEQNDQERVDNDRPPPLLTPCYHPRLLQIRATSLPGVLLIEPKLFGDDRGFFMETYRQDVFRAAGIDEVFVQDNHSRSARGVLRGLHYQEPNPQGKLVRCTRGALFDVAVDIRRGSPSFGKWFGIELSEANRRMLWVPPGFAHGFCALEDGTDLVYKCTAIYEPSSDRSILWNDPEIGIEWPITSPLLSAKDEAAPSLRQATTLPQ